MAVKGNKQNQVKCSVQEFFCFRGTERIYGKEYQPKDWQGKLPILIISHGFLGSHRQCITYAETFAKMGYAVFIFDFNGGGLQSKSTGKTTDMTIFTEVMDLKAVIAYAKERPETDATHVLLMGCSQGGFVSAITAAQLGHDIERLILFYPALCVPDDARKGKMVMARFDPQHIPETVRCGPMLLGRGYPESVKDKDAYTLIQDYKGPVQIIHGTADKLVNISYSQKAHNTYQNCTLTVIDGASHGFKKKNDIFAIQCVKEFLAGRREILNIDVRVTGHTTSVHGRHVHITFPFTGVAVGDDFHGEILPGAADEQDYIVKKERHLCADYRIKGTDATGNICTIHVINRDDGEGWKPKVSTDSKYLSEWNQKAVFAVMEERKGGPSVHLFL